MRVTEIRVNAGRTLQHPCETYANLRPEVALTATLDAADDPVEATRRLQRQAEQLVEEHALILRSSLLERRVAKEEELELERLSQSLVDNQERVETLKEKIGQRQAATGELLFALEG